MKAAFKNTLGAAVVLSAAGLASITMANDGPALLLTPNGNDLHLEVLSQNGVTALQFDVAFRGVDISGISTESCLGALAASHTGGCSALDESTLRVVVFSPSNAELPTGALGSLSIPGVEQADIKVQNLLYGNASGQEIPGQAFVDSPKGMPLEAQDER